MGGSDDGLVSVFVSCEGSPCAVGSIPDRAANLSAFFPLLCFNEN